MKTNTWITSDLHFRHTNIMKFCPQSRAHYNNDIDYMTEKMVEEWNELVQPRDLTYILGDVAFCGASEAVTILKRLNGSKILVEGNHDRKLLKDATFRNCFTEIHKYLDINYNGTKVVMFHYPIAEWDQMHRGSVHFHGHLHGSTSGMEKYRCRDMGMDATGSIVISIEDAIADALTGEIKSHH
jgi:calcineurin-like phosphoesterase family protein